jgi:pre-60S factor REI1
VKRRVASLPPVPQEIFTEKVLAARANSSAAAAKASYERTCAPCQKTFYSENSFQNHVKSSKHRSCEARVKQTGVTDDTSSILSSTFSLGEPISRREIAASGLDSEVNGIIDGLKEATIQEDDAEDEEEDDEGGFPLSRCLFCSELSSDLKSNVDHMFKIHGMFVPEKDYLVNLEGLIRYLHAKITGNMECLYCHAIKNTVSGARTHMLDKGHCMIAFGTEEEQIEIGQFYDFTSTYSDDEEGEPADTASAAASGIWVKVSGPDGEAGDGDGWETDSTATSVDADNNQSKPYRGSQPIYQTEYELYLPSGRSVGHRSLARYYRQNLHNYPTAEERVGRQLAAIENGTAHEDEQGTNQSRSRALITRANGGLGLVGATAGQKKEALSTERREQTRAQRAEVRYAAKVSRAANSQKHFRVGYFSFFFFSLHSPTQAS